jgi:hypothetical protein
MTDEAVELPGGTDGAPPPPRRTRSLLIGLGIGIAVAAIAWGAWDGLRQAKPNRRNELLERLLKQAREPPRQFEARFPHVHLVPGLVGTPTELEFDLLADDYAFISGPDRKPGLWRRAGTRWAPADDTGGESKPFVTADWAWGLDWIARPGKPALALAFPRRDKHELVTAYNADGSPLWTWQPPGDTSSRTTLFSSEGAVGIALGIGGDAGIVALDLDGHRMWNLEKRYVVYDVESHPALPGLLLEIGGDAVLWDHAAGHETPQIVLGAVEERARFYAGTYIKSARLFPDAHGKPAIVLAGSSIGASPVLVRVDGAGKDVWRATLPSEAEGFEMIEPTGLPRLFLIGTATGEFLVVGDDGTLYAREAVGMELNDAGQLRAGEWAVLFQGQQSVETRRLRVEMLPAR